MSVHSIRDGIEIKAPGTPRPDLIAEIEKLLEMARSGEIAGIAVALSWRDECTSHVITGQRIGLIGELEIAKARLVQEKLG